MTSSLGGRGPFLFVVSPSAKVFKVTRQVSPYHILTANRLGLYGKRSGSRKPPPSGDRFARYPHVQRNGYPDLAGYTIRDSRIAYDAEPIFFGIELPGLELGVQGLQPSHLRSARPRQDDPSGALRLRLW